jgi:hypothetical protein
MSPHPAPVAAYLLSEDGHARLCRLVERLGLLAELARGYVPPAASPSPILGAHYGSASLGDLADGLDAVLGDMTWQGEGLEEG